jgi:hypothetical protein
LAAKYDTAKKKAATALTTVIAQGVQRGHLRGHRAGQHRAVAGQDQQPQQQRAILRRSQGGDV